VGSIHKQSCKDCKKKGLNILSDIKGNKENIYTKCPYAVLSSPSSKCLGQSTGFVSQDKVHIDHIVPLSDGGIHSKENLQDLCSACNLFKGNNFSQFDSYTIEMFHSRYHAQINTFLLSQNIVIDVCGMFKMTPDQLVNFNNYTINLVKMFRSSSTYLQSVEQHIRKYNPIILKKLNNI
jgi:hypothetical protein